MLVRAVQARDYPVVMAATGGQRRAGGGRQPAGRHPRGVGRPERSGELTAAGSWPTPARGSACGILALAVLAAVLAPCPRRRSRSPARRRGHPLPAAPSPPIRSAASTCSAPTASAATSGARLLFGARISLGVGVLATFISIGLGVAVGAAAGFWQRWVGTGLLGFTDFALALPRVVLLLLLAALWQPSAMLVVLVLGFTGWMPVARLVYGEVRALRAGRSSKAPWGSAPATARAGAPRPAQRADAGHRGRGARPRQRDPARGGACRSSGSACSRRRRRGET